jgi:hypothetical protein
MLEKIRKNKDNGRIKNETICIKDSNKENKNSYIRVSNKSSD